MTNAMKVAVLPGDGIGREVVPQALKVLHQLERTGLGFDFTHGLIGGAAVEAGEAPLPQRTLDLARSSGAILFGAVGDYANDALPRSQRAGSGLLKLRKELTLFANFRPAVLFPELIGASSLKPEIVSGLDLIILRELNGDLYFGEPRGVTGEPGARVGINTMRYSEPEIERVAHAGFRMARKRRGKLCSVDKANVLETMALWREVVTRIGAEYPDVELSHEAALTDAQFDALRPHFSDADLVDLLLVIGFYACVVRVLASLRIDVEPDYQPYLDRFPLPA